MNRMRGGALIRCVRKFEVRMFCYKKGKAVTACVEWVLDGWFGRVGIRQILASLDRNIPVQALSILILTRGYFEMRLTISRC